MDIGHDVSLSPCGHGLKCMDLLLNGHLLCPKQFLFIKVKNKQTKKKNMDFLYIVLVKLVFYLNV